MYILLTAATTFEIQPTMDHLAGIDNPLPGRKDQEDRITVLITGVGGMAATWALTHQIGLRKPDLIIQAGIAGTFTNRPLGDVVAVGGEIVGDLGVWEKDSFRTLFDMKFADPDKAPYTAGILVNPYKELLDLTCLDIVLSSSVNEITTSAERIRWHQQNTGAIVESMEGASLHYVCLQENVPFLQIRAVSNKVGIRDKTQWDIRSSIANLNAKLIPLLETLLGKDKNVLKLS